MWILACLCAYLESSRPFDVRGRLLHDVAEELLSRRCPCFKTFFCGWVLELILISSSFGKFPILPLHPPVIIVSSFSRSTLNWSMDSSFMFIPSCAAIVCKLLISLSVDEVSLCVSPRHEDGTLSWCCCGGAAIAEYEAISIVIFWLVSL